MKSKICEICKSEIDEGSNFCPMCGEAISENAKIYKKQLEIKAQLEVLANLAKVVKDTRSLELIKSFILKLKSEI